MYDDGGDYVEKEFGKRGYFDDAKNGEYKIKAYRVDVEIMDKTTYKGGKEFASIKVTAHPGEIIKITFNYKKKSAKMTTDYIKPVPKPIAKPAPVVMPEPEPMVEAQGEMESPEFSESQTNQVTTVTNDDDSLIEVVEDFVHPDALAMEIEKQEEADEIGNIFKRIWDAIVKFFSFG